MINLTFNECLYSGKLWDMLYPNIILIAILAMFGCGMLSTLAIRDIIKKQVNKKTWFIVIFFAISLLLSGTLLDGASLGLLSEECGNYAELIIRFIIKMFEVLLLGILLLTTSFLITDKIVREQKNQQEKTQKTIDCKSLTKREIIIITFTTTMLTNIFIWIANSIAVYLS